MKRIIVTPKLIDKYGEGKCTSEEIAAIYEWYDMFEDEYDPLNDMSELETEELSATVFDKLRPLLTNHQKQNAIKKLSKRQAIITRYAYYGVAATVLVAIVFILSVVLNRSSDNDFAVDSTSGQWIVIKNQSGGFHKNLLSDGSVVWLSPQSQLEYPNKFIGNFRQVKIKGGAFFEVAKDHAHPFIIYGGGVITKVWGTSFKVNAYDNKPTEVSVVTGKVSVRIPGRKESEVMLLPKQKVTYNAGQKDLSRAAEVKNSSMRIWDNTTLEFRDTRVDTILASVNRHFRVHIYSNDEVVNSYSLKADFRDQNLASILDILESSINVAYKMDGDEIELYRSTSQN